jgi:hypothetical protein
MKLIVALFIVYIKPDENESRDASSQSCQINKRIDFILKEISKGDKKTIVEHGNCPLKV